MLVMEAIAVDDVDFAGAETLVMNVCETKLAVAEKVVDETDAEEVLDEEEGVVVDHVIGDVVDIADDDVVVGST